MISHISSLSLWGSVLLPCLLYLAILCLSLSLANNNKDNKKTITSPPTNTPQQNDQDALSVWVAWSILPLCLSVSRLSSSLSSEISMSCCNNCRTLLSVLAFCSVTNLSFTLSRLSLLRVGIDRQQTTPGGVRGSNVGLTRGKQSESEGIQKGRRDSREERPMILT